MKKSKGYIGFITIADVCLKGTIYQEISHIRTRALLGKSRIDDLKILKELLKEEHK